MAKETVESRRAKGLYWDKAWKVVDGCTKCSPGCDNCWSETETAMRTAHPNDKISSPAQFVIDPHTASFDDILQRDDFLDKPLKIKKPTVFALWNDLYHEDVSEAFINDVYGVMMSCPQHTFLVLTKRAQRMADLHAEWIAQADGCVTPANHIWHGVTCCNQSEADEKIPLLMTIPGKRFLSLEPLLGPIDIEQSLQLSDNWCEWCGGFIDQAHDCYDANSGIHQVLLGGESGKNAREMQDVWARAIRDWCKYAGSSYLFKQWGEWLPESQIDGRNISSEHFVKTGGRVGKKKAGRHLDGQLHDELVW